MGSAQREMAHDVKIRLDGVALEGTLAIPADARGVVVFAHGSGSGRHSPRNRFVADSLTEAGLATLLIDLLMEREEEEDAHTGRLRFDIDLLSERVAGAVDWVASGRHTAGLPAGCFGASTGAAAALRTAAARPDTIRAVVSRGGRPDLAGDALDRVSAPTLLVVGGEDRQVIPLNRRAQGRLGGPNQLALVPGATHLFEEPGALETVAELAREWFLMHLAPPEPAGNPGVEWAPARDDAEAGLPFRDRSHAGRELGAALGDYAGRDDTVVLGLARGGVPVAAEVARALGAPLDVFLVRKLGTPGREELAMGAIASGGVQVLNDEVVRALGIDQEQIEDVARREQEELERRERDYRGDRAPLELAGRTAIVVDDGLATGASMRAAVQAVRRQGAARVIVGVPVASPATCAEFREDVDEIVCVHTPRRFGAVGSWYEDFSQTTDEEVRRLLSGV